MLIECQSRFLAAPQTFYTTVAVCLQLLHASTRKIDLLLPLFCFQPSGMSLVGSYACQQQIAVGPESAEAHPIFELKLVHPRAAEI